MAVVPLFESLDKLEALLTGKDYLFGGTLTEADIRLWVTLVSFLSFSRFPSLTDIPDPIRPRLCRTLQVQYSHNPWWLSCSASVRLSLDTHVFLTHDIVGGRGSFTGTTRRSSPPQILTISRLTTTGRTLSFVLPLPYTPHELILSSARSTLLGSFPLDRSPTLNRCKQ